MNATERFTKAYDQLIGLGLPPRLVLLYGKLAFHAGADGKCYPTHRKLAEEIGLRSRRSHQHVLRLLNQLRQLRLIEWKRGRYYNFYQVLDPDTTFLSHQMRHRSHISDVTGKSHRKESSSKETFKRGKPLRTKPPRKPEPPAGKNQEPKKVDDDEPKTKPRPQASSPEREFRKRLIERHGSQFPADRCIHNVRRQLEKTSGLSMADFLVCDLERTTAPAALKNPNGYYTQLAKELRSAAVAAAFAPLRPTAEAAQPDPPLNAHGRCSKCGGAGQFPDGPFCECRLGRDLALQARRKPKSETTPPASSGKGAA